MLESMPLYGSLARFPRGWLLAGSLVLLAVGVAGLVLALRIMPGTSVFEVAVRNDLPDPVTATHCSGSGRDGAVCDTTDGETPLSPGQQFRTITGVPGMNPFIIRTADGRLVGCLTLEFAAQPSATPTVQVSEAGPCVGLLSNS